MVCLLVRMQLRNVRLTTRKLLQLFRVASTLDGDGGGGFVNLAQVIGGEIDGNRAEVFVQSMQLACAGDRDDPWLLCQQPRQRYLGGGRILSLGDVAEQIYHCLVRLAVLRREARDGVAEVAAL